MRRELPAGDRALLAYGHWGRPLLAFPSESGSAWDWEQHGMVGAIAPLLESGRVKLYCVESFDAWSWADRGLPTEERARRHGAFEHWVAEWVVPAIHRDLGAPHEVALTGCSLGAFHAVNFALKRADVFPLALAFSGVYDVAAMGGWGERGDAAYFNSPLDYARHLHGDYLEWLRSRVNLLLVCGQGQWEDTTGALESTRALAGVLAEKGLRYELDLWGYDVPHDWPSWRAQIAHHLPRFV